MAWVLLVSLNRVESFICAMFLCGLSGSIFLIVPVYINEFCEPSIRGTLSSSALLFHGIGTLISYGLGGTVDYATLNYTGLSLAVLGLFLLSFLRESPLYLMKKGLDNVRYHFVGCQKVLLHENKFLTIILSGSYQVYWLLPTT